MAADAVGTAVTTTRTAFAFQHAPEPWHLLLFAVAAIALGWWAWRRYGPAPAGPAGIAARLCRVAALVLAVAMLSGPAWRTTATTVLPARLLIAIDRSASMQRTDGLHERPRIEAARELAAALETVAAARGLTLSWQGVGGEPGELDGTALARAAPAATGTGSPLADECAALVAERRPDHLVLLTDGRVTEGSPLPTLAEPLRARGLQVSVLAVGGETVEPGLWLDEVEFNKEAALGEAEMVVVRATARALPPGTTTVRLIADGKVIDEQPVEGPAHADPIELTALKETKLEATFSAKGPAKLRVEIEHGALKDARELAVTVAERKLQVLLLDSRPRYEARYLREALMRDHTIVLHAYLGDGRWRRWQTKGPEDRVPLGAHDLKDYDVVIIGDLGPDQLPDPEANVEALARAVREQGVGLIWIPGETGATARFARSKNGDKLLPVELPDETSLAGGYRTGAPHHLQRTSTAESLRLLDSGGAAWSELPETLGGAPIPRERVRPGAQILMTDQENDSPVVISREYDAGRTIFIAVDDTWRWRRNVGDRYLHRFYSQLLRYAAARRRQNPNGWRLVGQPHRAVPGELVTVQLLPSREKTDPGSERAVARLVGPDGREQRVELQREDNGFSAKLPAPGVGTWTIDLIDGPNPAETEPGELVVLTPTSEARDPRSDRPALVELARATGGQVFDDAASLVAALPDKRQVREDVLPARGLWDNGWTFAALLTLLALEWSLRRVNRLP